MHDLKPITALGAHTPRVDTIGGAVLTENTDVALASVHARLGKEDEACGKFASLLGADAPGVGQVVFGDTFGAMWTGPDQWMISGTFERHETMAPDLADGFSGIASVTEQTDAWAIFELTGVNLTAVMELLCPINMLTFAPGDVARTSIHHLNCFVVNSPAGLGYRIMGPRASAGSLHHAIVTAMRSAM